MKLFVYKFKAKCSGLKTGIKTSIICCFAKKARENVQQLWDCDDNDDVKADLFFMDGAEKSELPEFDSAQELLEMLQSGTTKTEE